MTALKDLLPLAAAAAGDPWHRAFDKDQIYQLVYHALKNDYPQMFKLFQDFHDLVKQTLGVKTEYKLADNPWFDLQPVLAVYQNMPEGQQANEKTVIQYIGKSVRHVSTDDGKTTYESLKGRYTPELHCSFDILPVLQKYLHPNALATIKRDLLQLIEFACVHSHFGVCNAILVLKQKLTGDLELPHIGEIIAQKNIVQAFHKNKHALTADKYNTTGRWLMQKLENYRHSIDPAYEKVAITASNWQTKMTQYLQNHQQIVPEDCDSDVSHISPTPESSVEILVAAPAHNTAMDVEAEPDTPPTQPVSDSENGQGIMSSTAVDHPFEPLAKKRKLNSGLQQDTGYPAQSHTEIVATATTASKKRSRDERENIVGEHEKVAPYLSPCSPITSLQSGEVTLAAEASSRCVRHSPEGAAASQDKNKEEQIDSGSSAPPAEDISFNPCLRGYGQQY